LLGGLAIGTNRGENLKQLEPFGFDCHFVIAISQEGLSTPQVYARFDEIGQSSPFSDLGIALTGIQQLARIMNNDLEPAATTLLPSISNTIEVLKLSGAIKAMVTGSGPTVIGLFDNAELAKKAAQTLAEIGLIGIPALPSYLGTRLES
jgi:4-diphosphocytidyl-2-C-methyl-D-erythritol kinase